MIDHNTIQTDARMMMKWVQTKEEEYKKFPYTEHCEWMHDECDIILKKDLKRFLNFDWNVKNFFEINLSEQIDVCHQLQSTPTLALLRFYHLTAYINDQWAIHIIFRSISLHHHLIESFSLDIKNLSR